MQKKIVLITIIILNILSKDKKSAIVKEYIYLWIFDTLLTIYFNNIQTIVSNKLVFLILYLYSLANLKFLKIILCKLKSIIQTWII